MQSVMKRSNALQCSTIVRGTRSGIQQCLRKVTTIINGKNYCDECAKEHEPCPVCLVRLDDGRKVVKLSTCGHRFHQSCASHIQEYKCPLCREEMSVMDRVKLFTHTQATPLVNMVFALPPTHIRGTFDMLKSIVHDMPTMPAHRIQMLLTSIEYCMIIMTDPVLSTTHDMLPDMLHSFINFMYACKEARRVMMARGQNGLYEVVDALLDFIEEMTRYLERHSTLEGFFGVGLSSGTMTALHNPTRLPPALIEAMRIRIAGAEAVAGPQSPGPAVAEGTDSSVYIHSHIHSDIHSHIQRSPSPRPVTGFSTTSHAAVADGSVFIRSHSPSRSPSPIPIIWSPTTSHAAAPSSPRLVTTSVNMPIPIPIPIPVPFPPTASLAGFIPVTATGSASSSSSRPANADVHGENTIEAQQFVYV